MLQHCCAHLNVFFFQMHCCGVENYADWYSNPNLKNNSLPISCCHIPSGAVKTFTCDDSPNSTLYRTGCLELFGDYIRDNTASIEIAGLTLAVIQVSQVLILFFSCLTYCSCLAFGNSTVLLSSQANQERL